MFLFYPSHSQPFLEVALGFFLDKCTAAANILLTLSAEAGEWLGEIV